MVKLVTQKLAVFLGNHIAHYKVPRHLENGQYRIFWQKLWKVTQRQLKFFAKFLILESLGSFEIYNERFSFGSLQRQPLEDNQNYVSLGMPFQKLFLFGL